REQHLSTLDGLAAAAAHELGTPLATIALAAREMQTDTETRAALRPDIDLIAEQAARCRAILAKLRSLDPAEPSLFSASSLSDLVAEVAAPHRDFGISIDVTLGETDGPEPSIRRNAGLIYGLGNIIENAVDYSRNRVTVTLSWSARLISVEVVDDGEGFPAELFARLGEPYLTTRPRTARPSDPAEPGGLGLGIFIAKTLLERSGGRLRFSNAEAGARVSIAWPRQRLEVGLDPLNFDAKA
ncbi:MAG: ATP-binding protein, partial [Cucumibacter sp.]